MNIDSARQKKVENHLSKLIRYKNKVISIRDWITTLINEGGKPEIKQVPAVQYNRIKFNRMNYEQQKEYEKRLNTLVPEYRISFEDETYFKLNKTEYEFALSIIK